MYLCMSESKFGWINVNSFKNLFRANFSIHKTFGYFRGCQNGISEMIIKDDEDGQEKRMTTKTRDD